MVTCLSLMKNAAKIGLNAHIAEKFNWRIAFKDCGSQMRPTGLWLTFRVLDVAETWHCWWYYSQHSYRGAERWLYEVQRDRYKCVEDIEWLAVKEGNLCMVWTVINERHWEIKWPAELSPHCKYPPSLIQDRKVLIAMYVFRICDCWTSTSQLYDGPFENKQNKVAQLSDMHNSYV